MADFPIDDDEASDKAKAEYRALQYVLSPLILKLITSDTDHGLHFVIKISRQHIVNKPVTQDNVFTLLRDFGNGMMLYVRRSGQH
jgi:hypothetical protein